MQITVSIWHLSGNFKSLKSFAVKIAESFLALYHSDSERVQLDFDLH